MKILCSISTHRPLLYQFDTSVKKKCILSPLSLLQLNVRIQGYSRNRAIVSNL